uniref:Midnolin n=1 Tax=Nomascus leucogenys TaxID=61853 RepID=A0A2I3GLL7_NOMLE
GIGGRGCPGGAEEGGIEHTGGPDEEKVPGSWIWKPGRGGGGNLSVSPHTSTALPRGLCFRVPVSSPRSLMLFLPPPSRLSSGKLQEFGVGDGSKLTLVPTVEAGLMSQASRPEQSVMQALESLTETQVSDFLSGRSPLTLALRVGDHMMFVQLQLAAQHAPLQHRHVLAAAAAAAAAARGDPSIASPVSSPCRPVSSAARVPPVPTSPSPASPSPITAGSFRSHAASTTCPEQMNCSPTASSSASPGASTASTPGASPAPRSRKPGAVIESFVNHAPGVLSGTFSGRLLPGLAGPRPGPQNYLCEKLAAAPPASLLQGQSQIRMCKPPGDRLRQTENRATRCKVERLQLLLQQKRLRRKARRDARGPYHWSPSRKAGRSDSSSSGGGGSPSEASGLGLDFEDSVWKPEVNPDIKSEFVVA